jgi:hypothetical protein
VIFLKPSALDVTNLKSINFGTVIDLQTNLKKNKPTQSCHWLGHLSPTRFFERHAAALSSGWRLQDAHAFLS